MEKIEKLEEITVKRQVKYFTCCKNELERINEGLQCRNIDANSIISITENENWVTVWYRVDEICGYVDESKNSKTVEKKFMDFLNTFTDKTPLEYIKSELEKGIYKNMEDKKNKFKEEIKESLEEQLTSETINSCDLFIKEIESTYKYLNQIEDYRFGYICGYVDAFKNSKTVEKKFMVFLNTFTDKAPLSYIKSELEKGIDKRIEGL
jgi:hypothetical protein